jgi:hypothetical protein
VRSEVFTAVNMKNAVFWVVTPCDSCKNRSFGGTIGSSVFQLLVTVNVSSSLIFSPWWWKLYVLPKHQFLRQPHEVASKKDGISSLPKHKKNIRCQEEENLSKNFVLKKLKIYFLVICVSKNRKLLTLLIQRCINTLSRC